MDETIDATIEQRRIMTEMIAGVVRDACDGSRDQPASAEALKALATNAATAMVAGLKIINASN